MTLLHTLLATLVTLGILVTVHEWGHFYIARRCGVKVLRFSIGFGKPLLSWRDRHNTEFVVAAIPLGGYVKMLDEREGDVPADELAQTFNRKNVWQRIAIVAAGPAVNLLFAVFAYWLMFVVGVTTVAPKIGAVLPETPAAQAGVPAGFEVVAIDGNPTLSWEEVNLRLASRVGETGALSMRLQAEGSDYQIEKVLQLNDWKVDLEKQSPVTAIGLEPWRPDVPAVIGTLVPGERAELAGLQLGDQVLQIDGEPVADWYDLVAHVQAAPGQLLQLQLLRDGQKLMLDLTPAEKQVETQQFGYIGAGVQPVSWPEEQRRTLQEGPFAAVGHALAKTWQMITLTLDAIWKMIEGAISVKNLSGPITIAKVAGASAASGFESFVSFLAYLSVSLGILNLLPIPVLDGGHLLYYLVEVVTGRPVSERVQMLGMRLGMAIVISLMGIALLNDFMRL
ncbi:sigma E protease regulator RseP [Pontibacter sp. JAM-7]|uniref:sigma E protease regulator RseP n=1 Tax=Pontibacter sp. JAM-7 TaxID=3366581 RepID=UPI003AF78E29